MKVQRSDEQTGDLMNRWRYDEQTDSQFLWMVIRGIDGGWMDGRAEI